ncbi:hypothetical protein GYMLUDRAFT_467857 [Collybiopsis luxurians FD-317 M1]|uniref:Uncharacterized protein n=1 Tax=Collybiopsis luxurians FD-317 M1 TaxID=944289 RepID=A0A0D0CKR6_9AGAR|nr:hypothetical protein GYMLUDRAFT_467857 [Collybiopsis luxurians FD-317 M1]
MLSSHLGVMITLTTEGILICLCRVFSGNADRGVSIPSLWVLRLLSAILHISSVFLPKITRRILFRTEQWASNSDGDGGFWMPSSSRHVLGSHNHTQNTTPTLTFFPNDTIKFHSEASWILNAKG